MRQHIQQSGNIIEYDVLVIGTGLAGLHYCQTLLKLQPNLTIALISKDDLCESNSRYAQGGIACVQLKDDSYESHIEDTLLSGDGLCDINAVNCFVRQSNHIVKHLSDYGVSLSTIDKQLDLGQEGGHQHRRIIHAGDMTGHALIEALLKKTLETPQIKLFPHHMAVNLIASYHPHRTDIQSEIKGAYILDCQTHKIHAFIANCVILATGGAGKTYRYTSNPMVATGDGVAMAYRAGARVGNMEFYQFHPTLLHHPLLNNFLISEAVRGEGARLICPETGDRFMAHYAKETLELSTRDIVSRAIFNEIEHHQKGYVHLDITHQSKDFLKNRFPTIFNTLLSIGIDMIQDILRVLCCEIFLFFGFLSVLDV
jgi:L-aspartate oxidase